MKNINNHNKDSLWKRIIKLMDEIIFDIQQTDILQLILFRINTLLPVYSEDFKIVVCLNDKSDNESNSIYNKMKNCPIICDCEKIIFFRTILSLFDNYSKKITEKKYKALTLFDEKCKCTLIYNPPESENLFLYDWGMERKRARIKQLMEFNKNIIVSSLAIIRVKYVLHGPDYISQSNELTDKRIDCYHDCIKSNKFVVLVNTDSNDINSANNLINDISRCFVPVMDDITDIKCFCGQKSNIEKQLSTQQFYRWRDIVNKEYTEVCKFVDKLDQEDQIRLKNNLKNLPKCLVHFTRKVCNCDMACVADKFRITSFDHTCEYFDLENLYLDDAYRDCSFLKYKVIDNNIVMNNATISFYDLRDAIYFDSSKLCNDKNQLNALQCSAYDLRDECKDKENCISFLMNKKPKNDCSNDEYRDQLEFVYRIINFQERYILKQRSIRSSDYNIEFYIDSNFQDTTNSTKLNLSEENFLTTNHVILAPIISGMILSLSGLLILNNKNKEKKISICVFLLGGFLFIYSLFLALQ